MLNTARTLPVFLLFSLLIAGPAFAQADKLEGTWLAIETILSDCSNGGTIRTLTDMIMFSRGGSLVEIADSVSVGAPPLTRLGPGLGAWEHVAGPHFTQHFTAFRYDPTLDGFAGLLVGNKDIELSKDGNSYTSTGTADVFDQNGVKTTTRCTTGTATRLN